MRSFQVVELALIGVLALVTLASAQDKEPSADPFPAHSIKLAQQLTEGMSLDDRLALKGSFNGQGSSLRKFAEELERALGISVVLAAKKLAEAEINPESPLTFNLKNVKVQTALRLILDERRLTYVTHDNVIVITTPEDAGSQLVTRVYDCRDLLQLPSSVNKRRLLGNRRGEADRDGGYTVGDLIEIITTVVHPDSWFEGSDGPVEFKGLVIITQTQEVQEDMEKLLNQLHKAGGLEQKIKVSR